LFIASNALFFMGVIYDWYFLCFFPLFVWVFFRATKWIWSRFYKFNIHLFYERLSVSVVWAGLEVLMTQKLGKKSNLSLVIRPIFLSPSISSIFTVIARHSGWSEAYWCCHPIGERLRLSVATIESIGGMAVFELKSLKPLRAPLILRFLCRHCWFANARFCAVLFNDQRHFCSTGVFLQEVWDAEV